MLDNETEQCQEVQDDTNIESSPRSDDQPSSTSDKHGDPCIWDSNEIQVLRQVLKTAKVENGQLRGQVRVLQDDVQKMTTERRAQRKLLESTAQRLHRAETANKRLQMLANHLKSELDRTAKELDRLKLVEEERNCLSTELQKMQSQLSSADSRHDRDVAAAEAKWLTLVEEQRLTDTDAKTQLNSDVARLVDRVEALEQQLSEERSDHSRTRQGLEQLRLHFFSLPTSGQKSNHVDKDQLANWTY